MPRLTPKDIVKGSKPIVCLTAYTADIARLLDKHVDLLLVGDSLGNVLYGFESTRSVTLDMMIAHGAAVVRSTEHALIVLDMPFGTYEESPEQALRNCKRAMAETGCAAVKLEGGQNMAPTIKHLVENGVPVMGHIGLLPQSVGEGSGFKIQGKDENSIERLKADVKSVAEAGAFSIVIEGTIEPVARELTQCSSAPTIGIGASASCDGQILVINDVLGLTLRSPKFSKKFADLGPIIEGAAKTYAEDVRSRKFPGPEHVYVVK